MNQNTISNAATGEGWPPDAALRLALARRARPATPTVAIVLPVFNEEASIAPFLSAMDAIAGQLGGPSGAVKLTYIFVNDGSRDGTLGALMRAQSTYDMIHVVDLSRNFGKEAALSAGFQEALDQGADVIIPMDVDLQDPPDLILSMMDKWRLGYQVVLARRSDRSTDSPLKAWSAKMFYRLFNRLSAHKIPENVGDFRLMDRQVVAAIGTLRERGRMMKALMSWVGFNVATLEYKRPERAAGRTSFNPLGLVRLAMVGVLSFSTAPLRAILYLGLGSAFLALSYSLFIGVRTFLGGVDVPGYASTIVFILVAAAVQLTTLGVVGEYIARLFEEAKARPLFIRAQSISPATAQSVLAEVNGPGSETPSAGSAAAAGSAAQKRDDSPHGIAAPTPAKGGEHDA